jgi:hypothetical protein
MAPCAQSRHDSSLAPCSIGLSVRGSPRPAIHSWPCVLHLLSCPPRCNLCGKACVVSRRACRHERAAVKKSHAQRHCRRHRPHHGASPASVAGRGSHPLGRTASRHPSLERLHYPPSLVSRQCGKAAVKRRPVGTPQRITAANPRVCNLVSWPMELDRGEAHGCEVPCKVR